MEVIQYIDKEGNEYYSNGTNIELMVAILHKLSNWKSIVKMEMSEQEYNGIVSTSEAAELFRL